MGSTSSPPFWGYLIKSDKSPSGLFEQLLLGIANYINRHVAPWDIDCLTPTKLAAFYRLVGGDCDPLFLETPHASLSFIYQSIGCFHTLQQEKSPYDAPSVPALTREGFVRWQTVQVLLEPDQHVAFLQNAVKRLDIINPADGTQFPRPLPREALPSRPDPEMVRWHEGVAEKLMIESYAIESRAFPADKDRGTGDNTTSSSIASSHEDRVPIDTARYLAHPRPRLPFRPPPSMNLPRALDAPSSNNVKIPAPWDLERRRSSTSDIFAAPSLSWPHDNSTPTTFALNDNSRRSRPRTPSTVSTSSVSSSSSSFTASSASVSPRIRTNPHRHLPHQHHHRSTELQHPRHPERRHSFHESLSPRGSSTLRNVPTTSPPSDYFPPSQPMRPPGSNTRGWNVRWEDNDGATTASYLDWYLTLTASLILVSFETMASCRTLFLLIASILASFAVAAVRPDVVTAFEATQKPAPAPGTHLNATSQSITMQIPGSDLLLSFRNFGRLIYQADTSLCLLEGCSDLFAAAVRNQGDAVIANNHFDTSYGHVHVTMNSYSPPAFRLTYGHCVNVLRGIGLFMSVYGYFQVDFDIMSSRDGHVGIGSVS
ncbi:MAG: hypothetical protein Q9211_000706 [Gyalolechia sp. 1 TL-2023]